MHGRLLALGALVATSPLAAERAPVLPQVDVPHSYYWREMYLPQLTSGPSSVAWMPRGELIYSMQGSLWRQQPGETLAVQLTTGPGYDYQPEVSPDGLYVVFARYTGEAIELQRLTLATGEIVALTAGGDVNVEPRYSPDGSKLAYVSTKDSGRFHLRIGRIDAAGRLESERFAEERQSAARYYYSRYDHELSPSWSPDGRELVFVANPDIQYGTGFIWRAALDGQRPWQPVRVEETTWKARPDWSPDGRSIVYSSYLGRQWHQLWITTATAGGDPFPLSYGEFDATAARWSPDGSRIAFISNEGGDLSLRIMELPGGEVSAVPIERRRWRRAMAQLSIVTVDSSGGPLPARISVRGARGQRYGPAEVWMHADDGFDRSRQRFETQYFHSDGEVLVDVPAGPVEITVWRGLEHRIERRSLRLEAFDQERVRIILEPLELPAEWRGWLSGDVHVHMNYCGTYRNTPERMIEQARAEDLDIVYNLVVNKEQRIPDIGYFRTGPDPASRDGVLLLHGQEYHTSFWGHLGLLGLDDHYLLPDYAAYPNTAAASLQPSNAVIAGLARRQRGLVGYVHPFDWYPEPPTEPKLTHALPIDAALGNVDYYEAVGFSDHLATARVWHQLLNCGIRIAAAAGTDAMANFASLRGPVGLNRVYVRGVEGETDEARHHAWLEGLKAGRSIATNGPLLDLAVESRGPGEEIELPAGAHRLRFKGALRSIVPIDHLELIVNGEIARSFELEGDRTRADVAGEIDIERSGWLLLRAWSAATPDVFDLYPYGTTGPIYVTIDGRPPRSPEDAAYFLRWIDRVDEAARAHAGYRSDDERIHTLDMIRRARAVFEARR